jgi:predicted nucleic acid-binding protein
MTTSIDSNVIVALWLRHDPLNRIAAQALTQTRKRGSMVISAPVFAELMGDPERTEKDLERFFSETGITVEWDIEEEIWRVAGKAYQAYIERRRSNSPTTPRRILADFLIGAHGIVRGYSLLTFDQRLYAAAFPKLKIISS